MRLFPDLLRPRSLAATRDRLRTFRQLFLVFALLTLGGVAVLVDVDPGGVPQRLAASIWAVLLAGWWVFGFRRRRFPPLYVLGEAALLVGFTMHAHNVVSVFPTYFIGMQYRALFGSRRDTWVLAFAYGFAFLIGAALSPLGLAIVTSGVIVKILALGFCAYVFHTLQEVLERDQERERALRDSEQRFRSVAENLREALLITDVDDRIILANSRVREVLGYEPEEVIGKNATDLLLPEAQRSLFREKHRRRLLGESELYEAVLARKDGKQIHAEVSASPHRSASGAIVGSLAAISDISERKRLEDRLREGMRLEAVGQLAGGVAHDFNNLLTVIKCHTELMLGDLPADHAVRPDIAEIAHAADRGATLTQQLLAFSRKQLLQPRRVTLAHVVAECAPRLRQGLAANVLLRTEDDQSGAQVFADKLQLEYVLNTLAQNSNDAMPMGGAITIETQATEMTSGVSSGRLQEMPEGRYMVLSVSDTGLGMDPQVLTHLFEPFFTTKGPGEGTGLGLASVYGIVRQSGGFVDVESAPNTGTTFRIYLPLADSTHNAPVLAGELQPA